jgi:hypothetical protein
LPWLLHPDESPEEAKALRPSSRPPIGAAMLEGSAGKRFDETRKMLPILL